MRYSLKDKRIRIGRTVIYLKPKVQVILMSAAAALCTIIGIIINIRAQRLEDTTDLYIKTTYLPSSTHLINHQTPEVTAIKKEEIILHISGAVRMPGLVCIEKNSRIADAIEAAGGALNNADIEIMNLASYVYDGMKIYVPYIGETPNVSLSATPDGSSQINNNPQIKININTAGVSELSKLSGIGESTAKKIIAYREEFGHFQKIEDILQVSGIGNAKFLMIKNQIYV